MSREENFATVAKNVFSNFKQKVPKRCKNSRIKLPREFKVANCGKTEKIRLIIHLIEQKSCNLLSET